MSKIKKILMGFMFLVEIEEDETQEECKDTQTGSTNGSYYGSHFTTTAPNVPTKTTGTKEVIKISTPAYHKHIVKNAFWEVQEDESTLTAYDNHGIGIDLIDG